MPGGGGGLRSAARGDETGGAGKECVGGDEDTPQDPVSAVDKIISEYEGYSSE